MHAHALSSRFGTSFAFVIVRELHLTSYCAQQLPVMLDRTFLPRALFAFFSSQGIQSNTCLGTCVADAMLLHFSIKYLCFAMRGESAQMRSTHNGVLVTPLVLKA